MKKFLITLIVLLLILAVAQAIYYNVRPEVNIPKTGEEQNTVEQIENSYYIYGMVDLYENYKPNLSIEELQNKMYDFVYIKK